MRETYSEIGSRIGKTRKAVEIMSSKLGLLKKYQKWRNDEEEFLESDIGKLSLSEIAKRLGRPKSLVYYRKM